MRKLRVPSKDWLAHFGEGHEEYSFICPGGCGDHRVIVHWGSSVKKGKPEWSFNGNLESPTFKPSLLVSWDRTDGSKYVCHSFITDGKIQFLPDCTHSLAGKTVSLQDIPE